tara:strand:- start:318 stop:530 length:213 start_codon:yes stop_codon:yes gene_type:complete
MALEDTMLNGEICHFRCSTLSQLKKNFFQVILKLMFFFLAKIKTRLNLLLVFQPFKTIIAQKEPYCGSPN